jgi:hypothetical protein
MVLRLCAPSIHLLCARNRKAAISGWALMASRVANRVAVSTPLRTVSVMVLVIAFLLVGVLRPVPDSLARKECRRCQVDRASVIDAYFGWLSAHPGVDWGRRISREMIGRRQ